MATVPFGDTAITLVGTPTTQLAGELSADLPWIVLGVGALVSGLARPRSSTSSAAANWPRTWPRRTGAFTSSSATSPAPFNTRCCPRSPA